MAFLGEKRLRAARALLGEKRLSAPRVKVKMVVWARLGMGSGEKLGD